VIEERLFNTVGPRHTGRYGMVLPTFARQALEGAPITVFGTGQQSRCFCDVRDSVAGILRLIATDKSVGEVVNVGSDREVTVEELARMVKERAGSASTITFTPYDQAYEPGFEDMQRRVPALEKLERLTGFRPATPLEEIVDRVVEYFQNKGGEEILGASERVASRAAGTAAPSVVGAP
jgi:UDP-glucose 4-epimerase